jgi:hypothetical protein
MDCKQFQEELKRIQEISDDESNSQWLSNYFFDGTYHQRCRFSVLLENIRKGDVSVFLKHLEKKKEEFDQKFEQHQKGMHDKNQQEQMERHQKRQMIPRKDVLLLMNLVDLKNLLRQLNLPYKGKKQELVQRLAEF